MVGKNTFKGMVSNSVDTLEKLLKRLEREKDITITIE